MKGLSPFVLATAIVFGTPQIAVAQSPPTSLTPYLAAHAAIAAGNTAAATDALAALASTSTSTTVVDRARMAAKETDLTVIRRVFRDISLDATQWVLPDDVAIYYCAESYEGRGAFWLQRIGATRNPYDPDSTCGEQTSVGRLTQETTVVGYLDTYRRPDSYSATRLNAPLMDVPLTVTPITRDLMDDQNTLDVNTAVRNTSTTTPAGFDLRPNFYLIRGFYVLNYRDGIRTVLNGSAPINPFSLEGVEILRGPSSILYGKGEPGGLVNFTSKRPVALRSGTMALNFGADSLMRGDVDLSTPIGKSGAGRLIVSGYNTDSYRASVSSDAFYVNPSVSFKISPRASVWLTGEFLRHTHTPDFGVLVSQGGTVPAFFTRDRYMGDPALAKNEMNGARLSGEVELKMRPDWDLRLVGGTELVDPTTQVSFMNLVDGAATGYQGLIAANNLLRLKYNENPRRTYQYGRVENVLRAAHGARSMRVTHQLIVTADYRRDVEDQVTDVSDYDIFSYVDGSASKLLLGFIPVGQGQLYKYVAKINATQTDYGLAAQDLISVGARLNVLAGLRYESNVIDTVQTGTEQTTAAFGGPLVSIDAAPPKSQTHSVAPRLGVVFKATSQLSLFGSYLTAFISPVPGLLTSTGATLKPEHSRQFEGGFKALLRDERISFTASAYATTKDDSFVFYPTHAENEGREESKGAEVELMGAVTREVNLVASYAYTDMQFTKSSPDLTGKTRPGVPRHAFSSWLRYQPKEGTMRGLSVAAGVNAIGQVWASFPNTASLDAITTVDAMIGFEHQQWRIQVNGSNLNDALGYTPSGGFYSGGDPHINPMSAVPIAPRRVTVHLAFRF